ncbi:GH25 family lysozyme [Bariatricus sp. SGI.154]|uniref:GH25 family lysozyme n=1 Tax=Bariatricus sp. SGI.154 TaxID=3420549 RepID=UPI003D06F621
MRRKRLLAIILLVAMLVGSINLNILAAPVEDGAANTESEQEVVEEEENQTVDVEESDVEEKNDVEEIETKTDENNETEEKVSVDDPEEGDRANSWRYKDGELIESYSIGRSRAASRVKQGNITKKGIDVSEHNGDINWEKVKASGIEFAIIRCGYGTNRSDQDDKKWLRNVSECERLGIPYGVYIYSYATNTDRALSEAQHVLRLISGHNLSYPVYFDMEDNSTIGSDLNAIAQTFCSTIKNAGYAVGVYANLDWWNNYLTDTRFSQWYRWVAQWSSACNYTGEYALWQYSAIGSVDGISGPVDLDYLIGNPNDHGGSITVDVPSEMKNSLRYSAHLQDIGWMDEVSNGTVIGTAGMGKQMEAFKVGVQGIEGLGIEYRSYVSGVGWQDYVADGMESGTTGQSKAIEAVRIRLTGNAVSQYKVYYRMYVSNIGWLDWAKNDELAGTLGYGYAIEAYQVVLLPIDGDAPGTTEMPFRYKDDLGMTVKTHVSELGWQSAVGNGEVSGSIGKALEVEAYTVNMTAENIGIRYTSCVSGTGWQDYVEKGELSGTVGKAKSVEAVKLELTGDNKNQYNLFYRTYISNQGWLGWTKDGLPAGSQGYGNSIEAIQIMIVPVSLGYTPETGDNAFLKKALSVQYSTHVQDIGWQSYVENGKIAGTTGQNKQIEALRVKIVGQEYEGKIEYRTHVEDIGWQSYVSNGNVAGTEGKNKQVEAISIRLTGEMASKYDIYYCVHSSDFGWLGWAKNGANAGSEGYGKQVEAIRIQLVEKDGAAPGSTEGAFKKKATGLSIQYSAHVQDIGWQAYVKMGEVSGTTGKNKQIEAIKIQLLSQEYDGNIEYKTHVQDIGWQSYVKNGNIAGTTGKNKQVEAIAIRLTGEMAEQYDIYYRVHSSDFGWLGWAKNGANAGSEGCGKKAEALQIKIVRKGEAAPGGTNNAFKKK